VLDALPLHICNYLNPIGSQPMIMQMIMAINECEHETAQTTWALATPWRAKNSLASAR
jgi:hypothetical protein